MDNSLNNTWIIAQDQQAKLIWANLSAHEYLLKKALKQEWCVWKDKKISGSQLVCCNPKMSRDCSDSKEKNRNDQMQPQNCELLGY